MSLEREVSSVFYEHVFCPKNRPKGWRVLVFDEISTLLLSSCLSLQDITDSGITLFQNITRKRKAVPMEAIYILHPSKNSVDHLLLDFSTTPSTYPIAYVYFTTVCPDDLLKRISTSGCLKYFKALSVLNIGFLPVESHIFSINCHDTAWLYTCPIDHVPDMITRLDLLAEQIVTACVVLNEYPKVRYRKRSCNLELAQLVQMKLAKHREDNPQLGQGPHKDKSILLLLDRGFDPLTPLLHDLTLQALIRDLKDIEDNMFRYGKDQKFALTDKDQLWRDLRNEHIADVSRILPMRLQMFAESKQHFLASKKKADEIAQGRAGGGGGGGGRDGLDIGSSQESISSNSPGSSISAGTGKASSLRALQTMVREMPQYQKETASYNALVSMTDICLSACRESINSICAVEQDLVMGQTAQGDTLANPMMSLVNVLKPDSMSEIDRFRLLLIYIISQGGISEANLEKLLDYARLSLSYKTLVAAISSLIDGRLVNSIDGSVDSPLFRGLPNLSSASSFVQSYLPVKGKRLREVDENSYALSRWVPYLEDLLEKCISDTLDSQSFPYLIGVSASRQPSRSFLQTPDQSTLSTSPSGSGGARGPSARFRAPSPHPGSESTGLSNSPASVAGSAIPQRPGSGRHNKSAGVDDTYGQSRMNDHCGPRLIVFVVGGLTWPEARVCYSTTQRCIETRLAASDKSSTANTASGRGKGEKHSRRSASTTVAKNLHLLKNGGGTGWNWEIVLGGTDIITSKKFVENLQHLADYCRCE